MLSVPPLPRGCSRTRRPSRPDRSRSTASVLASRGLGLPRLDRLPLMAHECFSLPHIQSASDDLPRQGCRIARAEQRPGVPSRQLTAVEHGAERRGQAEQADQIGDVAAALAQRLPPAPPGCDRTRRSGAGNRPPPRAASGPAAARSRAAPAPALRGRTARRRPPAARDTPAICAARQRRSPATISYCSSASGTRRTRSGCITPRARIDSVSAASSSSPK